MKHRFATFRQFAEDLLPHEYLLLQGQARFEDEENRYLLRQLGEICVHRREVDFREDIDKRKYSALIGWARKRLDRLDADRHFEQLNELHRRIMTDQITPEDEKALLALCNEVQPDFYFSRLYHLLLDFRQFLQIRLRHREHGLVDAFLKKYEDLYRYGRQTLEALHDVTEQITHQYTTGKAVDADKTLALARWFQDEKLDGFSRYNALVRLTFIYYNQRSYNELLPLYEQFEKWLVEGKFYARRILVNYYGNRLLMHSHLDQLVEAERYGRLSLRVHTTDYLHYLNNLAAVLHRAGKAAEALVLLRNGFAEVKHTTNFHNRTGFVAIYLRCLNACGKAREAEQYAETFLGAFREAVFQHRWHPFFSAYLQALAQQQKFAKLMRVVKLNKLLPLDEGYRSRASYLPIIPWLYALAAYRETQLDEKEVLSKLKSDLAQFHADVHRRQQLLAWCDEWKSLAPALLQKVKSEGY